jgi:ABC-type nitrate/sulfonate/bicarbonate transport system substrate-binding protein
VLVDFAGTSEQVDRGVNCTLNVTKAFVMHALKCSLLPEVPNNDGFLAPIEVTAPDGCILNARWPAAVAARHMITTFVSSCVFGALGRLAVPAVIAESAGRVIVVARGKNRSGEEFVYTYPTRCGMGARPKSDGLSGHMFPGAVGTIPVEIVESNSPIFVRRKEFLCDSGGPGRYRGGCDQIVEFQVQSQGEATLACMSERAEFPARGVHGGRAGAKSRFVVNGELFVDPKKTIAVSERDIITCSGGGGGGFYPPHTRDAERVCSERNLSGCDHRGFENRLGRDKAPARRSRRSFMTSRRVRRIFAAASFIGLAMIFHPARSHGASAPLRKVPMSFPAISGAVGPVWVAKDLGYFEKNGLDVDPVLIQSGPRSVSALLSGEMPVINTGANSAISAVLGGTKEPVVIATFFNTLIFSVIGKPEIGNIAGLKGKVLGVTQAGSLSDFTGRLVLTQAGVAPQREVTLLPTGDYNGMIVSLSKGLIDAGVFSPPSTLRARKLGFREILDVGASGIEFASSSIATTRSLVRESPDIPRRVVKSLVEAIHRIKTDKPGAIRVLSRWTKTQDKEVLDELYQTYSGPYLLRAPAPSEKGVRAVLDSLADRAPAAKTANPKDFFDDSFVRELVDSGFVKSLYQ